MLLRRLNVGCFGGGTGLPSLIGGLKHNPWLRVNAIVTVFDSGGSSGVLRDQLGVLPPGDVLRCALALARNETEARRILLTRLSGFEHDKLGGHTGGNLLLSMMEQYSGDFLAAVDGLRTLLDCVGRVWPISVEQATVCAEYEDGSRTRGEVEVDAEQSQGRRVGRVWLEPEVSIHPAAAAAIPTFDVVIVNTGHPGEESLARYADEHKEPLPVGDVPDGCEVITGEFWQGAFARHTRRRLAYAVWGVLSQRLLGS